MTAFLVGLAAGLVIGFVAGAVFTVVQGERYERRIRQRFAELDRGRDDGHGQG